MSPERQVIAGNSAPRGSFILDVFNACDHENLVGFEHRVVVAGTQITDTKTPHKQLPLLPSVGASWRFD